MWSGAALKGSAMKLSFINTASLKEKFGTDKLASTLSSFASKTTNGAAATPANATASPKVQPRQSQPQTPPLSPRNSHHDVLAGTELLRKQDEEYRVLRKNQVKLGDKAESLDKAIEQAYQRCSFQHKSMEALCQELLSLPKMIESLTLLQERMTAVCRQIEEVEEVIGHQIEEQAALDLRLWKEQKEAETETYRNAKNVELFRVETMLRKQRAALDEEMERTEREQRALQEREQHKIQQAFDEAFQQQVMEFKLHGAVGSNSKRTSPFFLTFLFTATNNLPNKATGETSGPKLEDITLQEETATTELEEFLGSNEEDPSYFEDPSSAPSSSPSPPAPSEEASSSSSPQQQQEEEAEEEDKTT
ncbi:Dysbindin [Balamuthia mandrillaris]